MTLNLTIPENTELKPRITVFGVGGAGGNAVDNMIEKQLDGVEFVIANTDSQALQGSKAPTRIQIGGRVTEGLGAGARPSVGAAAAEESIEEIVDHLAGAHMCFITAGMGGGTGTGAAPIIAQAARELGVLTVGVVTKPFQFEGAKRMRQAEEGVEVLQKVVDTLIIIPNQNLFRLANEKTTFTEAFSMADDVLYQGVKGVTDLMVQPGLINLDFADVRAVMDEMGKAMMGTGEATGEDRAIQAAEKAIANPLLDEISLRGAKGVLINITGGYDLTLFELDEAANRIREEVDPDANIIVGSTLDTSMEGMMRVSVVATGIDASEIEHDIPTPSRRMAGRAVMPEPAVDEAAEAAPEPVYQPEVAAEVPASVAEAAVAPDMVQELASFDPVAAGREEEPEAADLFGQVNEQPAEPAYSSPAAMDRNPSADFVAPQRAKPGTPTPEALARLRTAVGSTRNVAAPARPQLPADAAEKRGFGINSLINRMTGHPQDQADTPREQPRPSPRLTVSDHEAEPVDPEMEKVEIPAFLRRQAN
ncbi:cell division protein FtsZ [Tropicimonas sp. S265A]|uniref:cell division protein FtsZ n=1 Tax=Tropicimonas sp. S265A TaxID=3415134 RepID=UPI003C7E4B07